MAVFLESAQGVLMIILMVAVGYYLAARKWFDDHSTRLLAKLVTQVALPPYMIVSITHDFSKQELLRLLPDLRFPVLSMLLLMIIAWGLVYLLHIDPSRRGLFASMFFNSNTVFVGLPINLAIFGTKSLPYVLVYYMANTTIFWTIGVYFIQHDGRSNERMSLRLILQKVFSAPLIGFMIGVVLVMLNWHIPVFLNQTFTYLGGLTIPLSMLFIGISVFNAGILNMRLNRYSIGILLGRFVIAPLLMTVLVAKSDMPNLMKQVFILQSCMPVMTNAPVVAKLYNADANFASIMVTETTLLSLVVVPVMMVLIKQVV
ncbi:AEC family transporter [Furfurilactobacillus siliginis]|uniref:Malate permease n=1 Tax=Furfurilactobacillus siliginis TaxID=348151 RepID=A0A0R2L284_9LACO|nr:AEC family transporter [Furfurilactobacillus siliginis]KRN95746.1 malate permease [Furfurilactobacillus siliginis]GEK27992.1 malate transporter [Furfurilactobacillus siliginis]